MSRSWVSCFKGILFMEVALAFGLPLPLSHALNLDPEPAVCPLSSPVYRDLGAAAFGLEQRVLLPKGCEALQSRLGEAAQQIRTAAEAIAQLKKASDPTAPDTIAAGQAAASAAVAGLSEITGIFSSLDTTSPQCAEALLTAGDFLVAFVDTVNKLTPYLTAFGGAQAIPVALGSNILTSSVKTFMVFHKTLESDMSSSAQRLAFIENACGYFRYDESVHQLLQSLKGEEGSVDDQVRRLRIELDVMKKAEVPAPAPSERIRIMDAGLVRDHESLSELESVIEQSALGSVLGCSVISEQIRRASEFGEFPAPAITRLRELLLESESSGLNVTARRSVLSAFERSQLEGAAEGESCTSRAREWLSLARQVLHLTELELGRLGRKDLSNTTEYKARQDWEKLFARKQKLLIDAEERLKSIRAMASRSADLEISELLSTREAIRRSLFGSRDDELFFGLSHRVGPAEGWLKYKWRQSQRALREFKRLLPQLRRNWLESDRKLEVREREFACSYTENALLTWALAGKHLESALFFCEVFSQTINPAAHPYVSRYCLGRFNRKGELSKEGLLEERLQEVKAFERDSAAIQLWREKNQCKAIDDHRALSDSDRAPRG